MTWGEWQTWFQALLGLGDWFGPTAEIWVSDVFVPGGTSPEEVRAAALVVARDGPPKTSELLAALIASIRSERADRLAAEEEQSRLGGADLSASCCRWCDGTGWVVVPHSPQPAWARERDHMATQAVRCRCHSGQRFSAAARAAESLDEYEMRNPGWFTQMQARRARDRAEVRADGQVSLMAQLAEQLRRRYTRTHTTPR